MISRLCFFIVYVKPKDTHLVTSEKASEKGNVSPPKLLQEQMLFPIFLCFCVLGGGWGVAGEAIDARPLVYRNVRS